MQRVGWNGAFAALLIAGCLGRPAMADDAPRTGRPELSDVDGVLERWQKRMASVTTIEAKFRRSCDSKVRGDERWVGRIILASSDFTLVEESKFDDAEKPTSVRHQATWSGGRLLLFDHERNHVSRIRRFSDRNRPPIYLSLPFLFQLSVAQAKERFDWKIVGDEGAWIVLEAAARAEKGTASYPRKCRIALDRASLLPARFTEEDGPSDRNTYELADVKVNVPIDDDLKAPCLDAWWIDETPDWLAWLFFR